MFKLKGRDLHISRTEEGTVIIKSKTALQSSLEPIDLRIYDTDSLDEGYRKKITGKVASDGMSVSFPFSATDTDIEKSNEILDYWYDIRIGLKVIGYDENKARHLYIYPVGSDSEKQ